MLLADDNGYVALAQELAISEKRSMGEEAYSALKSKIVRNELAPGYQVLEEQLARSLGMSRTPVREALLRLEQEGFIELVPRRGMRVKRISARDVREISEVLSCLECEAAERLAARKPGSEEIARLEEAIAQMDRALERDDMTAWAEADYRFHAALIELCGNRHLIETARVFLEKAHRIRLMTTPLRSKPVYSNVNHAAVVEAIRRGDAQTALDIHRAHKRRWGRELGEVLAQLGISD